MARARRASFAIVVVACAAAGVGAPRAASAQVPEPLLTVSPASAEPGGRVLVWLENWPVGVVTVQVCGNDALRGSQDCDNISGRSVPVRDLRPVQFVLTLPTPPVGCPCVVRATTTSSDLVRAAPIDLVGVPSGVHLEPAQALASADAVEVGATVRDRASDWPRSWLAPFGGDADKELVVTIENHGSTELSGLRIAGQVGRRRGAGEPIAQALAEPIVAGARARIVVPFDISAPAFGDYVVSGTLYGLAQPVRFSEDTHNDPWALEVAAIAFVLLLAALARRKERRARRLEQDEDEAAEAAAAAEAEWFAAYAPGPYAPVWYPPGPYAPPLHEPPWYEPAPYEHEPLEPVPPETEPPETEPEIVLEPEPEIVLPGPDPVTVPGVAEEPVAHHSPVDRSSLDVGDSYDERCEDPSYAPSGEGSGARDEGLPDGARPAPELAAADRR